MRQRRESGGTPRRNSLREAHYSERVDDWALGCVIYELMSGEPPFYTDDDAGLYRMITEEDPKLEGEIFGGGVSAEAIELISGLLTRDPLQRLAGESLRRHKWWQLQEDELGKTAHSSRKVAAARTFAARGAVAGHLDHFVRTAPGVIQKQTSAQEVGVYLALSDSGLAGSLAPLAGGSGAVEALRQNHAHPHKAVPPSMAMLQQQPRGGRASRASRASRRSFGGEGPSLEMVDLTRGKDIVRAGGPHPRHTGASCTRRRERHMRHARSTQESRRRRNERQPLRSSRPLTAPPLLPRPPPPCPLARHPLLLGCGGSRSSRVTGVRHGHQDGHEDLS
jgi:hypothetical protein